MKKIITILIISTGSLVSFGQMAEIGYNTVDVGAEFQYYKDGKFIGLHFATNAKLHHSFHGEIGYYIAGDPTAAFYYNQNKGGIGLGFGYRYYTMLRPHAFFIGVKANLFSNKVTLTTQTPENYNSTIFIPALETGYMILINDMFFITPTVAIGYKTNLRSELKGDEKKAVGLFGISMGFKF
jgi:hypothetical protein